MARSVVGTFVAVQLCLGGLCLAAPADEFIISATGTRPSVARVARGFAVVWEAFDDDGWGAFGQFVGHGGVTLGPKFPVNTSTAGYQHMVVLSPLVGGGFVVAWASADQVFYSVKARLFGPEGRPLGREVQVSSMDGSYRLAPAVAGTADGGFIVTWTSSNSSGSDQSGNSVQARLFSAEGVPKGEEFQVNTHVEGSQGEPAVAASKAGTVLVVWVDGQSISGISDIKGQYFDSAANPIGEEFKVNTFDPNAQEDPQVTVTHDDGFVVVWTSAGSADTDPDDYSFCVLGQRYGPDGAPVGADFPSGTGSRVLRRGPLASRSSSGLAPRARFSVGSSTGSSSSPAASRRATQRHGP